MGDKAIRVSCVAHGVDGVDGVGNGVNGSSHGVDSMCNGVNGMGVGCRVVDGTASGAMSGLGGQDGGLVYGDYGSVGVSHQSIGIRGVGDWVAGIPQSYGVGRSHVVGRSHGMGSSNVVVSSASGEMSGLGGLHF